MGFPTKVQLIKRQASEQWYINFPSAVAQAMEFQKGESVEWIIEDKSLLALRRHAPPAPTLKKTLPSSTTSSISGRVAPTPPRPGRRPLPNPRAELAVMLGTPHSHGIAHHLRRSVSRLDRRLSFVLPAAIGSVRVVCRNPFRVP